MNQTQSEIADLDLYVIYGYAWWVSGNVNVNGLVHKNQISYYDDDVADCHLDMTSLYV